MPERLPKPREYQDDYRIKTTSGVIAVTGHVLLWRRDLIALVRTAFGWPDEDYVVRDAGGVPVRPSSCVALACGLYYVTREEAIDG